MKTIFEVIHSNDFLSLPPAAAAAQIREALPFDGNDDERLKHLGRLILIEQQRRLELEMHAVGRIS